MRARLSLFPALCVGAVSLAGCVDSTEVELEVSVRELHPDRVVLDVAAAPDLVVGTSFDRAGATTETDASGYAELTVFLEPAQHDEGIRVTAFRDGALGPDGLLGLGRSAHVGSASIELGVNLAALARAPDGASGPFLRYVGAANANEACVALESPRSGPAPELGTGNLPMDGGPFFGSPGATVTLGPIELEIASHGLGTGQLTAEQLLPLLPAVLYMFELPVTVRQPGADPLESRYGVQLRGGCQRALRELILERLAGRRPLVEGVEPAGDLTIYLRANDDLETYEATVAPTRQRRHPDAPLASAQYLAVERETGRRAGGECQTTHEQASSRAGFVERTYGRLERALVDTEVTIYRLPGYETLATRAFEASSDACMAEVYPGGDIVQFVRDTVSEAEGGRRRRR